MIANLENKIMNGENNLAGTKILIVDDVPDNRLILEKALEEMGYNISQAPSGEVAVQIAPRSLPDLILLDVMMDPGMDGFETCKKLKADKTTRDIPVIFITARGSDGDLARGFEVGGVDYITKPFKDEEVRARVKSQTKIERERKALGKKNQLLKERMEERTQEWNNARLEIIFRLGHATEYCDKATDTHIVRMSKYCGLLGRGCGMSDEEVELLKHASPMHDVGKTGVSDKILLKPGGLDPDESEIMQKHVSIGTEILSGSKLRLIKMAKTIVETHHERWDGTGYPNGLKGEEIPLVGRICSLCDVFDSLTSDRPYKKAWSVEKTMDTIEHLSGKSFDPNLVDLLKRLMPEILEIKKQSSCNAEDINGTQNSPRLIH